MNSGILILRKEIVSFLRNDRSALVVQILLILVWSAFLATNFSSTRTATTDLGGYPGELLWWVFFSVVVSGNFAGTVFVSERIQGSMEILLTSGLTRRSVLWGKIGFVLLMSFLVGFVCYGASLLWLTAWSPDAFGDERIPLLRAVGDLGLFVSATWMNATCGAWLSLRLPNPRLSHFAVFLVFSVMVMLHIVLWFLLDPLIPPLWAWFCIVGVGFAIVADRGFHGEKVVQPVRM